MEGMTWCVTYAAKLDAFVGCTVCTIAAASEGPDTFGISKQVRMFDACLIGAFLDQIMQETPSGFHDEKHLSRSAYNCCFLTQLVWQK